VNGAITDTFPFAEFVMSDANRSGLAQTIHPSPNKIKTVQVKYKQRILESAVDEGSTEFCSAETKRGECTQDYEIDPTANLLVEGFIESTDLEANCDTAGMYITEELGRLVDVLERKMATSITTQGVALAGKWGSEVTVNGSDEFEVNTLKNGSDDIAPFTMEDIDEALMKSSYCGPVFIGGGSTLWKYFRRSSVAGCCANQGIDLGAIFNTYGKAVAYDRRVKTALSSEDKSFVAQLGALQVLWWTKAGWKEGAPAPFIPGSNYVLTSVVTPRLGIPVDVYFKDDCPGQLSMVLSSVVKTVGMPSDMFAVADLYEGVNYTGVIQVVNT